MPALTRRAPHDSIALSGLSHGHLSTPLGYRARPLSKFLSNPLFSHPHLLPLQYYYQYLYDDPTTIKVHNIETGAATIECFAAFGWVIT